MNIEKLSADNKVANSKATLLFKTPFFGVPCMRVKWVQDDGIPTACTDGKTLRWNSKFFDDLPKAQVTGVSLHEIFHVVLNHAIELLRHLKKFPQYNTPFYLHLANKAMDYVINPKIKDMKADWCELPDCALLDDRFRGMHWVEVFNILVKENPEPPQEDGQGGQGGQDGQDDQGTGMGEVVVPENDDGTELSPSQVDEMEKELGVMLEQAKNIARAKGKLPSDLEEIADNSKKAKVNWENVLRRFVAPIFASHSSYNRLHRKFQSRGIKFPSSVKTGTAELSIGIDTSGSILMDEITQFLAELQKIVNKVMPSKVTVHYFHSSVWKTEEYKTGQKIVVPTKVQRGGTSFQNLFDKVNDQKTKPKALIVLTDLECGFPKKPSYPVLWVSTIEDNKAPYGSTTYLDAVA